VRAVKGIGDRVRQNGFGGGCAIKLSRTSRRTCPSTERHRRLSVLLLVILTFCVAIRQTAGAQQQGTVSCANDSLTTAQVVEKLVEMNLRRAQALHSYPRTRTYRVTYRGLLGLTVAGMVVDVTYKAPETKEFIIRSSTGSRLILDKVFKKLLQAEKEALSPMDRDARPLRSENYEFTMVGCESTTSRRMYMLTLEPKTKSKFLFRGRTGWTRPISLWSDWRLNLPRILPLDKKQSSRALIRKSKRFLASAAEP
jgi:hypothetical protein